MIWGSITVAVLIFIIVLCFTAENILAYRSREFLGIVPTVANAPSISIVVAARNEADKIEPALRSLMTQDYPHLEVVMVNDRSDDSTAPILERVKQELPNLTVITIHDLPPGWLGKNHALEKGAAQTKGDWILFTDADVHLHPHAISSAVAKVCKEGIDHLVLMPRTIMPTALLRLFVTTFGVFFTAHIKPHRVHKTGSRYHIGVGAFNFVRKSAYEKVGGHQSIARKIDDDIKLGKILKNAGYKQRVFDGRDLVSVEWYSTTREMIRGLTKNMFAGVNYNFTFVCASTLVMLLIFIWPYVALSLTHGLSFYLYLGSAFMLSFVGFMHNRIMGYKGWLGILFPFGVLLTTYVLWRSTLITLWQGGVVWRGTHYPLEELRK